MSAILGLRCTQPHLRIATSKALSELAYIPPRRRVLDFFFRRRRGDQRRLPGDVRGVRPPHRTHRRALPTPATHRPPTPTQLALPYPDDPPEPKRVADRVWTASHLTNLSLFLGRPRRRGRPRLHAGHAGREKRKHSSSEPQIDFSFFSQVTPADARMCDDLAPTRAAAHS